MQKIKKKFRPSNDINDEMSILDPSISKVQGLKGNRLKVNRGSQEL